MAKIVRPHILRTGGMAKTGMIALVGALALTAPVSAQDSVTDFRLPPAPTPSARPRVQGPVDPDNPFGNRPTPRATSAPAPTPSPIPSAPPSIALPTATPSAAPRADDTTQPRPRASASAEPTRPGPANRAARKNRPEAVPTATATPELSPSPTPEAIEPSSDVPIASETLAAPAAPLDAASSDDQSTSWLIALLAAGLALAGVAAWFLTKRRRAPTEVDAPAPEAVPAPTPQPSAPAALAPARAANRPTRPIAPAGSTALAEAPRGLSLAIEPVSLRISLAYATLLCRATILNNSDETSDALAIRGDLASAHRAVDQRATLSPALTELDALATVESLAPGATHEQRIELRLPLTHIAGFRKGGHQFFVPLARLALVAQQGEANVRVWTIGTSGSDRLGPICADTPRLFSELAAIEIETERWLALDPVRAAS